MAKQLVKMKAAHDHQQIARIVLDAVAPDAKPSAKNLAANAQGRIRGMKGSEVRAR